MRELRGIDLKRACLVPSSVFASPDQVAGSDRLSLAQKLAILRRWEFDARRVTGFGSHASMLGQVQSALQRLSGEGTPAAGGRTTRTDPVVVSEGARAPDLPMASGMTPAGRLRSLRRF